MQKQTKTRLSSKQPQITKVFKDAEKKESLYIAGENVNWCSPGGKQYGGSSKNYNYHEIQSSHCRVYIQRKQKH